MARTRYQSDQDELPLRALPAAALRAVFREGYSFAALRSDLLAGLVVGAVALPLGMALAIAVGVPPQHGLYTAIVAGLLAALLGGSRMQVSGPTAAFVVILAPISAKHGLQGLLVSGMMGGIILLLMGVVRLGRLIQFVPHPVTTGFTAGIALVIATLQLKDLFGLELASSPEHYLERVQALTAAAGTAQWGEALIGLFTLSLLILLPRITRRIPAPLLALPLAAALAAVLGSFWPGFAVDTIGSRFVSGGPEGLIRGIPPLPPRFAMPWSGEFHLDAELLRELLPGAFAIAMLGAIESLLSAVVADGLARTRHDPDSELIAIGAANVVAPFFGGIPATGAIARTATNIRYGARSPIAAMIHAATVLAAVVALAPLLGYLPMSAMAALLLVVAWNMSEFRHLLHTLRVAPRSDAFVLLACFAMTVLVDMIVGVGVGMVLAAFLFMRRMAEVTHSRLYSAESGELSKPLPAGVLLYEISGPLFFGAAQKAMAALAIAAERSKAVVLDLRGVQTMDATGLVALESALDDLHARHCLCVLFGAGEQPLALMQRAGIDSREEVKFAVDLEAALQMADMHERRSAPRA